MNTPTAWLTKSFSRQWFSGFLLFVSIATTFILTLSSFRFAQTKEEARFAASVSRVQRTMESRLDMYAALLRASSGLFVASADVNQREFHIFVERLQLKERYPGILGIGYARAFSAGERATVLAQLQQVDPGFAYRSPSVEDTSAVVVYLEPLTTENEATIGYDMWSEPTRRAALERARDTGEVTVSGKVTLLQEVDGQKKAGFLMFVPIYQGNTTPETVEERQRLLMGYIYAPFQADDLFAGMLSNEPLNDIDIAVYDGVVAPEDLLYNSSQSRTDFPMGFPLYTYTTTFVAADQRWQVEFFSNPNFAYAIERNIYPLHLVTGLVVSFMMFVLSRLHYKALDLAQRTESELQTSQKALTQSRIQYRALADNASDLVTVVDPVGNVLYASPSHDEILGYEPDALAEMNYYRLLHSEDFERVQADFSAVANGGTTRTEFRMRHRHGYDVTLEGIGTGLLDQEGESAGILIISRDITERQEMEQRKDEFISIASHELKTPVTSLKVYTQYLQQYFDNKNDHVSSELLRKMDQQLGKLTNLIRDLLDVSRIEAGRLSLEVAEFDLQTLVEEVVEMMQFTTHRHLLLMKDFQPTMVEADRDRISQVIINFLSNAIKYSPENAPIEIYERVEKYQVVICVQDAGPGISPSKQEKVFERFFRVEGPRQETFAGFGLGLYIASEIIKRHQGKIWVESQVGQGSAFCFALPLTKPHTPRRAPKKRPTKKTRSSQKKTS